MIRVAILAASQRALGRTRGAEDVQGWGHSPLYEEVAGIPLLIKVPGIDAGSSQVISSAIDVMPTVLDIFDQPIPDYVEGRSLLPAMRGDADAGREFVVSAQLFANPGQQTRAVDDLSRPVAAAQVTTITTVKWSFLYSADPGMSELSHLESDPQQLTNVIAGHAGIAAELHGHLVRMMEETNLHSAPDRAAAEVTAVGRQAAASSLAPLCHFGRCARPRWLTGDLE